MSGSPEYLIDADLVTAGGESVKIIVSTPAELLHPTGEGGMQLRFPSRRREIHAELQGLKEDAVALAARIDHHFRSLIDVGTNCKICQTRKIAISTKT